MLADAAPTRDDVPAASSPSAIERVSLDARCSRPDIVRPSGRLTLLAPLVCTPRDDRASASAWEVLTVTRLAPEPERTTESAADTLPVCCSPPATLTVSAIARVTEPVP